MHLALAARDFGVRVNLDTGDAVDLLYQVVRHRPGQVGPPHEEMDAVGVTGEVDGGLACGVGTADDVHVLPCAAGCFEGRRAVEDARSAELVKARRLQPPVGHPSGQDDGMRPYRGPVTEVQHPACPCHLERHHFARTEDLGTEAGGLPTCPVRQLRP